MAKAGYTPGTYHYDAKGNRVGASTSSAISQQKPGEGIVSYVPKLSAPTIPAATGPQSSTVATSSNARGQVDAANVYLNDYTANQQQKDLVNQTASATQLPPDEQSDGGDNKDILSTIDTLTGDNSGAAIKQSMFESINQQKDAAVQYSRDRQRVLKQLSQLQSNADANTSNLIEDIKTQYDGLVAQQAAKNRQYERGTTVSGLVSGRAQYAPEIQSGLLASAVNYGIQKIMDIQAERAGLITKAEIARNDMQFKVLTATADAIRQTYIDEQQAARDLNKDMVDAYKFGQQDEEDRAGQVASYVASTLTGNKAEDEAMIMAAAARAGTTPSALYAAVDAYNQKKQQDLPSEIRTWQYLKENGQIPSDMTFLQYQAAEAAATRAPGSGSGKSLSTFEANTIGLPELVGVNKEEVASALVNSKGQLRADDDPPEFISAIIGKREQISPTPEYMSEFWSQLKKDNPSLQYLPYTSVGASDIYKLPREAGPASGEPVTTVADSGGYYSEEE